MSESPFTYFLYIPITTPLSANNAIAFGITIRPLKQSANCQTNSTFNVDPTIINNITIKEYIFTAFCPNKYFTFIRPKKCHPSIVENAKNNKHTAINISPPLPKVFTKAV